MAENEKEVVSPRDAIRTAFLNQQSQVRTLDVFGVKVELRQPSLSEVLDMKTPEGVDVKKYAAVKILCDYCYVPGTNQKVFEDTDVDGLLAMPFTGEWIRIQNEIDALTNISSQLETAAKN